MHSGGQSRAMLRLDPPGLGTLSIHVGLGHDVATGNPQVNVLMVPAVAQTAQLLNGGIDSLRQALAAAGLSLGQTQIGAGGQGGGDNDAPRQQSRAAPPAAATPVTNAAAAAAAGVRAYA
jgi:flagellar hook-length control protein FliK